MFSIPIVVSEEVPSDTLCFFQTIPENERPSTLEGVFEWYKANPKKCGIIKNIGKTGV